MKIIIGLLEQDRNAVRASGRDYPFTLKAAALDSCPRTTLAF
jgi:hypothetical protein